MHTIGMTLLFHLDIRLLDLRFYTLAGEFVHCFSFSWEGEGVYIMAFTLLFMQH